MVNKYQLHPHKPLLTSLFLYFPPPPPKKKNSFNMQANRYAHTHTLSSLWMLACTLALCISHIEWGETSQAIAEFRKATAMAKKPLHRWEVLAWMCLYLTPNDMQQNRTLAGWDVLATILCTLHRLCVQGVYQFQYSFQ